MVFEVFWLLALSILLYVLFLLSTLDCCFLGKSFYLFRKCSLYWKDKRGISLKSKTREKIPKKDEMLWPQPSEMRVLIWNWIGVKRRGEMLELNFGLWWNLRFNSLTRSHQWKCLTYEEIYLVLKKIKVILVTIDCLSS